MATKKGTKKEFFEVVTPVTSTKISLYAAAPEELNGKVVTIDLTRSLRGKSFIMKMRVKAEGEKLTAEPMGLELAGSYIRRMFRKGADYVEDSFEMECRDGKAIIKPLSKYLIHYYSKLRNILNALRVYLNCQHGSSIISSLISYSFSAVFLKKNLIYHTLNKRNC